MLEDSAELVDRIDCGPVGGLDHVADLQIASGGNAIILDADHDQATLKVPIAVLGGRLRSHRDHPGTQQVTPSEQRHRFVRSLTQIDFNFKGLAISVDLQLDDRARGLAGDVVLDLVPAADGPTIHLGNDVTRGEPRLGSGLIFNHTADQRPPVDFQTELLHDLRVNVSDLSPQKPAADFARFDD